MKLPRWLRRLQRDKSHDNPVQHGMFRLMRLDGGPVPTFIGTRAWCSGKPYWQDGACKCTHTDYNGHV